MAVKKVRKKTGLGARAFSAGASREQSPLRPKFVEKKPPCQDTCPSGNRVREFVTRIAQAERLKKPLDQAYEEAWHIYTDTSPFPSVCGRVCPAPCETECNRVELEGAVNINKIERAIGDYGIEHDLPLKKLSEEKKPQKIAIVGGGPSGLSCAYQLARRGYGVTVFEAQEKAGGMLRYGIPGYRLPESVLDGEIQNILDVGVELKCGVKIGADTDLDELNSSYDAVYVALGAQQGVSLGVDGEDAPNVFSGVDFLSRFHHGEKLELGKDVVAIVVGGGDTAIDAARICKRLGANVTVLYRRTLNEMPAIKEEVEEAIKEGIKIEFLAAPVGFKKENGRVVAMRAIRMELGEPDASGRRRPVPIEGSEFEIPASAVISAVSQAPDFSGFESLIDGKDWIRVDDQGNTKVDGVWAGGDVTELGLVTTAVGHGRRAAEAIDRSFTGAPIEADKRKIIRTDKMLLDHYEKQERDEPTAIDVEQRMDSLDLEVNLGFTREQAVVEAQRCMSCGYCFDCEKCWMYCQDQAIEKPMEKGKLYSFNLSNCTGCNKCAEVCPCGFIEMV
ncbi:MAG: NAD(P)-binding protein [Gemmatimonadales bacterium]|jgi:NADPH-dependent glutamate synthase beta subunit-like oxidoreductase/Pyruvate/2-oxoacid:ferredoxin oxidoreductase delta subunit